MIKKWNDKLEKIFDSTHQDLTLLESRQTFELSADNSLLENLSYVHSFQLSKNSIHSVFTQLSSFFEIGFLFEKQNKIASAVDAFAYGQPIDLTHKALLLRLPVCSLFHIVKTPASAILKKLNYAFLNPQKKMNSFIISVSPTYSILIATEMAEPWLRLRLESLQKTLMKIHFE